MKYLLVVMCLILAVFITNASYAGAILLHKKDATVWLPQQLIKGEVSGIKVPWLTVHYNNGTYKINVGKDHSFLININLNTIDNRIWITCTDNGKVTSSDTLNLTLGNRPVPVVQPFAIINHNKATLKYRLVNTAGKKNLRYTWAADKRNPAPINIANADAVKVEVRVPEKEGIYYFNLSVTGGGDSAHYQTYVTRRSKLLYAFNANTDTVPWMDTAIVYEITPRNFVKKGTYDNITEKLPELRSLGINTIWLQPVYKTQHGGQGYDVIDYMALRPEFGTEAQLKNLIKTAKQLKMRVMFDFVPNHTSIDHPYAKDVIKNGKASHYYDYYQHKNDGKPYSSFYNTDKNGFVFYFWKDLVNLNYNNPEVQEWILQACKYWVTKYDVDGYRFDAVWGVISRTPTFTNRLRAELKAIKPDILLLAEDKGSDPNVYKRGFDAAYDWTADTTWVSQWSWQTKHDIKNNLTIFNSADTLKRAAIMREALFNDAGTDSRILRFIENNDMARFIASHNIAQTKTAAALMFAIPGIPLLYNGQEIGSKAHPYTSTGVFNIGVPIRSADSVGLFDYYQKLINLRLTNAALRSENMKEINVVNNASMLAFHKWAGNQHFIVVVNMNGAPGNAQLDLRDARATAKLPQSFNTNDILTNKTIDCKKTGSQNIEVPMDGFGIRWLLISK